MYLEPMPLYTGALLAPTLVKYHSSPHIVLGHLESMVVST